MFAPVTMCIVQMVLDQKTSKDLTDGGFELGLHRKIAIIYIHRGERRLRIEGTVHITKIKEGNTQHRAESLPNVLRRTRLIKVKSCSSISPSWEKTLRWLWKLEAGFNSLTYILNPKEFYWLALNICGWQTAHQGTAVCLYIPFPQAHYAEIKEGICALLSLSSLSPQVHAGHVGTMCACPHTNTAWHKPGPTVSSSKYSQLHSLLTSFLSTITMEIP